MNTSSFVYIAGPYRAKDGGHDARAFEEIDDNIQAARSWAIRLARDGIPFFSPHLNSQHFELLVPSAPPEYWLDLDFRILKHAGAILLIEGWKESKGAVAEWGFARDLGIPAYTYGEYDQLERNWKCLISDSTREIS